MELVSIIVPVYNIEEYIDRCVKSIVSQTYRNLEIILVDDGSKDHSGAACDMWALQDSRIKVVHKSNGGLSDARNAGINAATGQYIAFIDGDDEIHSEMIQRLYGIMQSSSADISMCRIQKYEPTRIFASREFISDKDCAEMTSIEAIKALFLDKIDCSACPKLYKSSIFSEISFPIGKTNEDFAVMYKVFEKAEKIVYISDLLYHYIQREGSITTTPFNEKQFDKYDNCVEMMEYVMENLPQVIEEAKFYYYKHTMYLLKKLCIDGLYKEYSCRFVMLIKTLRNGTWDIIRSKWLTSKEKLMYCFLAWFPLQYARIHKVRR